MITTIIVGLITLISGTCLGFFVTKSYMKKYLKENPPVNEDMLKMMMMQMGMKPSQKKINNIMKTMNKKVS